MKITAIIVGLLCAGALGAVAAYAAKPPAPPGQDPCSHGRTGKPCRPDPQPTHGKDCEHHGNKGGVDEDHCTPAETTTDTIGTQPTTPTQPETTTQATTTTAPAAIPSPPAKAPKPKTTKTRSGGNALPGHKPRTRMFHGSPHAIIQGSG